MLLRRTIKDPQRTGYSPGSQISFADHSWDPPMGSAGEFHYELTGTGWSEGSISIGGARCEVTASCLRAIEELLRQTG